MKIIAFIDPHKFCRLLGDQLSSKAGFHKVETIDGQPNKNYLNNGTNVVYIGENNVSVTAFDKSKANTAAIILVRDGYKLDYKSQVEFKILFHTETLEQTFNKLRQSKQYKGELRIMEGDEEDNPYQKIVEAIKQRIHPANPTFLAMDDITAIYEQIPEFDFILEAKLELLHKCLSPERIPEIPSDAPDWLNSVGSRLKKLKDADDGPFGTNYINALKDLREFLLPEL